MDETGVYYAEWSKSERKTPIQYINTYIWNLERWQRWPYMRGSKRDTDVKNRLLDSVGEGEGGMIWENSIEACILPYVKQIPSPSSMHGTGHSKPVHWANPGGWDGEGDERRGSGWGTHVHPWLIHVNVRQKPPQYCKVISLQLNKLIKKKILFYLQGCCEEVRYSPQSRIWVWLKWVISRCHLLF